MRWLSCCPLLHNRAGYATTFCTLLPTCNPWNHPFIHPPTTTPPTQNMSLDKYGEALFSPLLALLAQMVEHALRKRRVAGSISCELGSFDLWCLAYCNGLPAVGKRHTLIFFLFFFLGYMAFLLLLLLVEKRKAMLTSRSGLALYSFV